MSERRIGGVEYHHAFIGECPDCGGRMFEAFCATDGDERVVGFECEACSTEGRVVHSIGHDVLTDTIEQEAVEAIRSGWVRWGSCPRCDGRGWIEAPLCDLRRAAGETEPCPRCHTSGSVRADIMDESQTEGTI